MEQKIKALSQGDAHHAKRILEDILETNSKLFTFTNLEENNLKSQLWSVLFDHLQNPKSLNIHKLCLSNIRVLSRDKSQLEDLMTENRIDILLELADFHSDTKILNNEMLSENVIVEALMCLCNLVHNSLTLQNHCIDKNILSNIMCRIKSLLIDTDSDVKISNEIKLYDMKLLFIITALNSKARETVRIDHNGFVILINYLALIENESKSDNKLNDVQVNLVCEILKALFNVTIPKTINTEEEKEHANKLISVCKFLLFCETTVDIKILLQNNVVNILTCFDSDFYITLSESVTENIDDIYVFEGKNLKTLYTLVEFLKNKLNTGETPIYQQDNISPILTVMLKSASSCREFRKYLRSLILPPLKDANTRPEVGNTVRNQLCRLLTTPATNVRDLAANFLFVLCKENVNRMVKHTGYGNAAGLFASRGLLGPDKQDVTSSEYSSDSEDSDTDEYRQIKHTINPITGCSEPPRSNPMAGYTEEQKEYEAMKLVNLMDQLNKAGVVQPCRIGPDGKPEPVEHVLQLQEELPNQQLTHR